MLKRLPLFFAALTMGGTLHASHFGRACEWASVQQEQWADQRLASTLGEILKRAAQDYNPHLEGESQIIALPEFKKTPYLPRFEIIRRGLHWLCVDQRSGLEMWPERGALRYQMPALGLKEAPTALAPIHGDLRHLIDRQANPHARHVRDVSPYPAYPAIWKVFAQHMLPTLVVPREAALLAFIHQQMLTTEKSYGFSQIKLNYRTGIKTDPPQWIGIQWRQVSSPLSTVLPGYHQLIVLNGIIEHRYGADLGTVLQVEQFRLADIPDFRDMAPEQHEDHFLRLRNYIFQLGDNADTANIELTLSWWKTYWR